MHRLCPYPKSLSVLQELFILLAIFFLPISKALVEIGVISSLVLLILHKILNKEGLSVPRPVWIGYGLFFCFCLLSVFQAEPAELKSSIRGILKWVKYLGLFFVCVEWFQDEKRIKRALLVFGCSMLLTTINGFYQLATGTDFLRNISLDPGRITRMKSSLGAPNTLASFYLFAVPLSLLGFYWLKKYRGLFVVLFILFGSGLVLTFSRAAFLGLLLTGFAALVLKRKWLWLFTGLSTVVLAVFCVEPLRQNFLTSLNLNDITIGERFNYWAYTWNMIQSHPLTGIGVNLYHQKLPLFTPATETYQGYAHNSYLQMWAEIGLFGLLSFLFPLTKLWGWLRQKSSSNQPILLSCLFVGCGAFLIQAFFDNNFYALQAAYLFWIFWGMGIGLALNLDKKINPNRL